MLAERQRGPVRAEKPPMRRPVRVISCVVASLVAGTMLASGPASASSLPVSAIAAHGLGARRPTVRIAPRASALDVPPVSVDLRQWAVIPGDQGQVGSCVTWAIDYGMLGWYSRYSGRAGQPFAPMYTYSQINGGVDGGSAPSSALQVAVSQGSDTRAHYTQGDYDWRDQPTAAEKANAAQYKITRYTTLFSGSDQAGSATLVKQALAARHPVAIEMAVRSGFDNLGPSATDVDDDITSTIRGYHEVLALGYDAAGLIIENSWGTGWANGGFGRISWRVVLNDVWEGDTIDGFVAPPPRTPPRVTAPAVGRAPGAATPAKISYKVTWRGTAGTSGRITQYDAWYRVDRGGFVAVRLASATSTSFTLVARSGHTYRVAVRARAGTAAGAIAYGTTFRSSLPRR